MKASEVSHMSNSPADATSDGVFVDGMVGIEAARKPLKLCFFRI